MKIHDNAVEHLTRLLKTDITGKKYLRLKRDGCGWHSKYKIVLDERRADDILYTDRGFRVIVSRGLSHILATANIQYKKNVTGYRLTVR